MLNLLEAAELPTLIVATKIDKVKPSRRKQTITELRGYLELDDDALLIPYSSTTKLGLPELWRVIGDCVG